jgi:predicted nucleic acid-binding protein
MHKIVICNTSTIFYLNRLRELSLLKKLYASIVIPETVLQELEAGRAAGEDVPEVKEYPWIKVSSIAQSKIIKLLTNLGPGEAGVLALALEEKDPLVILDDLIARRIAETQNIKVTGTIGILLKSKQKGYINELSPLIKQLIELNFRISIRLQQHILKQANEL